MEGLKSVVGMITGRKGGNQYRLQTVFEQMNAEFAEDAKKRKDHVANNPYFNCGIAVLIVVNTIMIGVEVDHARGDALEDRIGFFLLDFIFAFVFFVEMLFRQNQLGWDYFIDPWNVFDYTLVVLNCADLVISISSEGSGGIKLASTLRVFRLLRVVRSIRGLKMFYGLWMIIQGLLDSLRTMTWVAVLLLIIVYCIAVALTTLVGHDEYVHEHWLESEQYVGRVWRSMWTVIQIITLDNWATDIARPLMEFAPASLFFVFLTIIVCTFGVMNIIIAVMVERMQTIAQENKDMTSSVLQHTEQELLKSMGEEFNDADLDGNGELEYDEFKRLIRTSSLQYKFRLLGIQVDEAESLFELMDADKSGAVTPEEFITGLQKLKGIAKGQDLVQLICFAQKQCLRAVRFVERLKQLNIQADIIQERLNDVGKGITHELTDRKKASSRNEIVWKNAASREKVITKLDLNRQLEFPSLAKDMNDFY